MTPPAPPWTPERHEALRQMAQEPIRTPIGTVAERNKEIRAEVRDALAEIERVQSICNRQATALADLCAKSDRLTARWEALRGCLDQRGRMEMARLERAEPTPARRESEGA